METPQTSGGARWHGEQRAAPLQSSSTQSTVPSRSSSIELPQSSVQPVVDATQTPRAHASSGVQGSPSLHGPGLGTWAHPTVGAQRSTVQGFPSSQERGTPVQLPRIHLSESVHASRSLQGASSEMATVPHSPDFGSQPTMRHGPAVAHVTLVVSSGVQAPRAHRMIPLQRFAGVGQSVSASQAQTETPLHSPATQASVSVQGSPSSQGTESGSNTHPTSGSHASAVHPTPSSQAVTEPD